MIAWSGIFHILATPFREDGPLDAEGLPLLIDYRWLPLIRYQSQPGAAPGTSVGTRKEILRRRGWIATATVRRPAPILDAATHDELGEILAAVLP